VSREHEHVRVEQSHNPLSPYFCKYTPWLVNRMFAVAILEDLMRTLLMCQILDTSNLHRGSRSFLDSDTAHKERGHRSRVQGSWFNGFFHRRPACKSNPPSKVVLRTGTPGKKSIFNSIARKFGNRKVTLNGEPRTCERSQKEEVISR
jgi:hypothetical protein